MEVEFMKKTEEAQNKNTEIHEVSVDDDTSSSGVEFDEI